MKAVAGPGFGPRIVTPLRPTGFLNNNNNNQHGIVVKKNIEFVVALRIDSNSECWLVISSTTRMSFVGTSTLVISSVAWGLGATFHAQSLLNIFTLEIA